MNDSRGVSARQIASSGGATGAEIWRVAIGDNRVQSMTPDQIAQAYRSGQLNERTPLWPPGTSRWQALGTFAQFHGAPTNGGGSPGLASYDEADDDPTRMWTGPSDEFDYEPAIAPPAPPPAMRPSARTGPRLSNRAPVSAPAPQMMRAPAPARAVTARAAAPRVQSSAAPSTRSTAAEPGRRGSGLLLVAGLVGLVGVGSAVLAARGDLMAGNVSAAQVGPVPTSEPAATPAPAPASPAAQPQPVAAAEPEEAATTATGAASLAAYDEGESPASAFVQGVEPSKVATEQPKSTTATPPASPAADSPESATEADEEPALMTAMRKSVNRAASARSPAKTKSVAKAASTKAPVA
jgi:hypothetical protein